MNAPSWAIRTTGSPLFKTVVFKDILALKNQINAVSLVFDTNSYYVDVEDQHFVINGGRKLKIETQIVSSPKLFYCVERRKDIGIGNNVLSQSFTYLLGYEGKDKMMFMRIAPDGKTFRFETTR